MQGFCHCLHPISLDFQTDAAAHIAKLREGGRKGASDPFLVPIAKEITAWYSEQDGVL